MTVTPAEHRECGHGISYGPDLHDYECCICCFNPCSAVTVEQMNEHRSWDLARMRLAHEREIEHVLTHGRREEVPF